MNVIHLLREISLFKMKLIVATDCNGLIGKDNTIPWYCKNDLKLFRKITLGHSIIYGRVTYESLPKKYLDQRLNLVVTHQNIINEKVHFCNSIEKAIEKHNELNKDKEIFVIGGSSIYEQVLSQNLISEIYLSLIPGNFIGDRYLPPIKSFQVFERTLYEDFQHLVLRKK